MQPIPYKEMLEVASFKELVEQELESGFALLEGPEIMDSVLTGQAVDGKPYRVVLRMDLSGAFRPVVFGEYTGLDGAIDHFRIGYANGVFHNMDCVTRFAHQWIDLLPEVVAQAIDLKALDKMFDAIDEESRKRRKKSKR
jgi:hypothetical protein